MSEIELKPCPFCGGESDLEIDHFPTYDKVRPDVYEVHCPICGGRGGEGWTKEEAIEAWNTRAERTCRIDLIESSYENDEGVSYWQCTECDETFSRRISDPFFPADFNYCPHCGAKVVE